MTEGEDALRIEAMESLPGVTIFSVALALDALRAAHREETLEATRTRVEQAEAHLAELLKLAKKAAPNQTEPD